MVYSLSGGNFDSKNFSIKQGVAGHVMQLWTIFKMKLEDFLVMIGLKLLVMACLDVIPPPFKNSEKCVMTQALSTWEPGFHNYR